VKVERGDGVSLLRRLSPGTMQLIFLDPPFEATFFDAALKAAAHAVHSTGFVYLEAPKPWVDDELQDFGLKVHRFGKAGAVHFHLLIKAGLLLDGA
jgi:16S rRNA (guanine966-N2)-methyltransferase